MKPRRIVKVKELAAYIQMSEITIRKWCSADTIPHIKIGKSVRFDLDIIDGWLDKQMQEPNKLVA